MAAAEAVRPPDADGVEVKSFIGCGACGSFDWSGTRNGNAVLIKVYQGVDEQLAKGICREVDIHRSFAGDPNIVQLITTYSFADGQHVCLVFDFPQAKLSWAMLPGGSRHTVQLTEPQVRSIAVQLLQVLQRLHAVGVVHRNICSDGIYLWRSGERCRIALSDFSCSRPFTQDSAAAAASVRNPTMYVGAAGNAAPEVLVGHPAYLWQSDIWSLGCLLVELAAGKRFFDFAERLPAGVMSEAATNSIDDVADTAAREQLPQGSLADIEAAKRNVARKLNLYLTRVAKPNATPVTPLWEVNVTMLNWSSFVELTAPHPLHFVGFSDEFHTFVQRMLQFDYKQRPTAVELLTDSWLHPHVEYCEDSDHVAKLLSLCPSAL